MITNFKIFEYVKVPSSKNHPKVGDYVICNTTFTKYDDETDKFIANNIGQVESPFTIRDGIGIKYNAPFKDSIAVRAGLVIYVSGPEIDYYSDSREALVALLKGKKFGL